QLNEINPSILVAPPSMLRKIAQWQQEGIIAIFPQKVISVAEVTFWGKIAIIPSCCGKKPFCTLVNLVYRLLKNCTNKIFINILK
ncbi:hypothetical protein ACT453_53285, partial [Bacillus sp. D-CC]